MRKREMMLVLMLALIALPGLGLSAELADDDYVNRYFGTKAVFITAKQLVDPAQNYWGNLLPQEFMYSQGTLVEIINAARRAEGRADLLNPADYPIAVSMETKRDDGRWEYSIEFHNCTPSEANLVLDSVTFTGALADCERDLRPLCVGYLYTQAQGLEDVELAIGDMTVPLAKELSVTGMIAVIKDALAEKYGENFKADIYLSANDSIYSGKAIYVNVTVYLDGAEDQFDYYGEMPEPFEG